MMILSLLKKENSQKNQMCLPNAIINGEFWGSFHDYTIFICKLKLMSALYSWNVFSLYDGDI